MDSDSTSSSSSYSSSSSPTTNPMGGKRMRMTKRNKMQMMAAARSRSRYSAAAGRRRRKMRGGHASPYTSATSYNSYVNGSGDSQWDRVFTGNGSTPNGNEIIGAQGQNSMIPPSVASSGVLQQGGRRRHKSRSKKGGYWAQVINQALVPFGLWGLQNQYGKRYSRKHGKK
uniref:Uncharacterized protein n=1 Tax=viral metagenome TaxID=1070528 RepID=A0A6C0B0E6_9ZZZZ